MSERKPMSGERLKYLEYISKLEGRGWEWHEQELIAEAWREIRRLRKKLKEEREESLMGAQQEADLACIIKGHEAAMEKVDDILTGKRGGLEPHEQLILDVIRAALGGPDDPRRVR